MEPKEKMAHGSKQVRCLRMCLRVIHSTFSMTGGRGGGGGDESELNVPMLLY